MAGILVVLFLLIIIQIFIIGVCFSNLVLNVKEYEISYNIERKEELNVIKSKVSIDIMLFKKIKIISIKIYEDYCEIFKIKLHFNLLKKLKKDEESGVLFVVKNIGCLDPKIQNINLDLSFCTESTMLDIFMVPVLSTLLSGIISNYSNNDKKIIDTAKSNFKFKITPQFIDKNIFKLNISTKIHFDTITTMFFIRKHQEI